jgi:hypothetical protein
MRKDSQFSKRDGKFRPTSCRTRVDMTLMMTHTHRFVAVFAAVAALAAFAGLAAGARSAGADDSVDTHHDDDHAHHGDDHAHNDGRDRAHDHDDAHDDHGDEHHDNDDAHDELDLGFTAVGDLIGRYNPRGRLTADEHGHDEEETDDHGGEEVGNRVAAAFELQAYATVDKWFEARAVLGFHEHGPGEWEFEIEELFADIDLGELGGPDHLGLRLGRFRTPFGALNRLHPHDLPFPEPPHVLRAFLSDHGDARAGAMLRLRNLFGTPFSALEFAILDGEQSPLLAGHESDSISTVTRLALHAPLMIAGVIVGLNHMFGWHETGERAPMNLFSVDLRATISNELGGRALVELRGAYLFAPKVGEANDLDGFYVWVGVSPAADWTIGVRGDWTEMPAEPDARRWAASAYLTWEATDFLRLRLGVEHREDRHAEDPADPEHLVVQTITAQVTITFGTGNHAHHDH